MVDAPPLWVYWLGGILLQLANVACWVATFFTLPGNWGIVALAALFAVLLPEQENGLGMNWWAVAGLVALVAGAAGAAKLGASRRSIALSMFVAMIGSIVGAIIGVPVPIVGPIIAALGGGAIGAFVGAYLGETWKGRADLEKALDQQGRPCRTITWHRRQAHCRDGDGCLGQLQIHSA